MINNFGQYNIQMQNPYLQGIYPINYFSNPIQPLNAPSVPQYNLKPAQNKPVTSNFVLNPISTKLHKTSDTEKFNKLVKMFSLSDKEKESSLDGVSRQKKLDVLLKNGTLLDKKSSDGSSVLDNIYKAATEKRLENIDGLSIAGQIIDAIYNPAIICQKFGDIPTEAQDALKGKSKEYKEEAKSIKYSGSGTCIAASIEFHMAHKHPAEYARWATSLSSPSMSVEKNIKLSSLSKNTMSAIWLLNEFNIKPKKFDFLNAKLELKPDKNARERVKIQDKYWDNDERRVIDVLIQSTLMNTGSQGTYDTLTDTSHSKFNTNSKGLIEFEKTFIESIVEDSERTSVIYQNVDANQNLVGWNIPSEVLQKHITDTIDSGEDVIIGYVLTAQECNEPASNPNKIVNGHEITIIDYKKDANGNMKFICNDTDDDKQQYIEYSAEYLLPKIHHAGYPVEIVGEEYPSPISAAA